MSDAFAPGARRLAGLAARTLGWRPGEFWSATPAELAAILSDHNGSGFNPLGRTELQALMERDRHD